MAMHGLKMPGSTWRRLLACCLPWLISTAVQAGGMQEGEMQAGGIQAAKQAAKGASPSPLATPPVAAKTVAASKQTGAEQASPTQPIAAATCFDEAQWQALQRSTVAQPGQAPAKALLYVWSPRMVFSAVHAHEVQQEAQALGLRFVPVHDGRLSAEEVAQALAVLPHKLQKQQNLVPGSAAPQLYSHPLQMSMPLCAPSLVERDAYRHFPTAWVVQQGGFHPVPLVSAMPPHFWRMGLQQRLQTDQAPAHAASQ